MIKNAHINNMSFYKGKKVFVTGHTGFKGTWLILMLRYLGADVCGYALRAEDGSLFSKVFGAEVANSIIGDVRDYNSLKAAIDAFQPEVVFHLAALAQVKDCFDNPMDAYSTNVMGTVNLLEGLRGCESIKSIVIVTTDKVYENKGDGAVYKENDLLGGGDPYATSKTSMEYVAKAYRESYFKSTANGPGLATVRASNVLGGGDHIQSRLIPSILNSVADGTELEVRNPNQTRPWQAVLDALNGYLTIGRYIYESPADYSEAWNIGPTLDGIRTVKWVVNKIKESYNGLNAVEGEKFNVKESETLGLDISKSLERLDWEPRLSCERVIELVVEFFSGQQKGISEAELCNRQIKEFFS